MNAVTAKLGLRVVGTLVGLTCLHLIVRAYILAHNGDWPALVLVVVVGFYCAYVGYVTWLKFSPRAVRHICGATLFWVFLLISRVPLHFAPGGGVIQGALYILLLLFSIWVHRRATRCFSVLIFDEHETRTIN